MSVVGSSDKARKYLHCRWVIGLELDTLLVLENGILGTRLHGVPMPQRYSILRVVMHPESHSSMLRIVPRILQEVAFVLLEVGAFDFPGIDILQTTWMLIFDTATLNALVPMN